MGEVLSIEQARAAGLAPLTHAYTPAEMPWLEAVLRDLRRDRIRCAAVRVEGGCEVWRAAWQQRGPRP